ncbi:SpoIIE family protein phosphatase [Paracrocinitomix mangrovi]|uniref:SpoIIE family protein phosphatase n=1 Tax=Paracrocinitomix mangrovi TaxID=2862509 RepID=UPI001C8E92FC|nr:SpoIIE family protein phosphatase [Paracrocinitomix mangrovi]UKN00832.1 SpoIIE family protein phosphatase [Paracrocinitomix mangrovi]
MKWIIYLFICFPSLIFAQFSKDAVFMHLSGSQLKSNSLYSHQWDSRGSLWAASDQGLTHFNGYTSHSYKGTPEYPELFKSNNILGIFKTGEDEFWITYVNDKILSKFNPIDFSFEHYYADTLKENTIPYAFITNVYKDSRDNIWLTTWGEGIHLFNEENGNCSKLLLPAEEAGVDFPICSLDLIELHDGKMLFTFFYENGLHHSWPTIYNPEDKTFQKLPIDKYCASNNNKYVASRVELASRIVNFVHQDDNGNIWFGTYSGLIKLDASDSTMDRVVMNEKEYGRPNVVNTLGYIKHGNNLWISTPNEGIMVVDVQTDEVNYLKNNIYKDKSLDDNRISSLSVNAGGEIWIMTKSGGVNVYQEELQQFHLIPWDYFNLTYVNRSLQSIPASQLMIRDSIMYITHDDGMRTVNLNNFELSEHYFPKTYIYKTRTDVYSKDFRFKDGNLAMVVHESPYVFHLNDKSGTDYPNRFLAYKVLFKHNKGNEPLAFLESIPYYSTVHMYDSTSKELEVLFSFPVGITTDFGEIIAPNKWLLSEYNGNFIIADVKKKDYILFGPKSKEHYFPDRQVLSCLKKDENVWLGTNNGIYSFNPITYEYEKLNEKFGLYDNESVNSIYLDEKGTFWLGLKNDLYCFNDSTGLKMRYGSNYGLNVGEFYPHPTMVDHQGKMYFTTINGVLTFDPDKLINTDRTLEIYLSDVSINDELCDFNKRNAIADGKYEFDWDENFLTFEFASNQLMSVTPHQFQYRLVGQKDGWINNGNSNIIRLTDLKDGDYAIQVKAISTMGSESNVISIPFSIATPFYKAYWFYLIIILILGAGLFTYIKNRERQLKRRSQWLETAVKERTLEVVEQKKEADYQREMVEKKQKEITDSISYAKRIQQAILPDDDYFFDNLPDSFILYKPKDIVAGDFYWMNEQEDILCFAVADCTGHGVPGAMVSVVCSNALNRAVKEQGLEDTGKFLDFTREVVIEQLTKDKNPPADYFTSLNVIRDGMDITLCMWNRKTNELMWSGANNPLWIFRGEDLIELKPDKQPIGLHPKKLPFTCHTVKLEKGDVLYLFTDGFADQFGEETGRKFKIQNLKALVSEIHNLDVIEQKALLNNAFEKWRGTMEQIDDVCMIGVRI